MLQVSLCSDSHLLIINKLNKINMLPAIQCLISIIKISLSPNLLVANRYLNSRAILGQYLQTKIQLSDKIVGAKFQVKFTSNKIIDQAHRLEIHNKFSSLSQITFLVKINKTSQFLTILVLLVISNSPTNNSIPWANLWGKTNSIKMQLLKLEILRKVLFSVHSILAMILLNS